MYGLSEKQMNQRVRVVCYGKLSRHTRREAIEYFSEGMACSDGSERERYASILCQLIEGRISCSDQLYV